MATLSHASPHFIGTVDARWNLDGLTMTLLRDFHYVDGRGSDWDAEKGLVTDGASIPRIAWTIMGSPFTGAYRNAAVIHDAACIRKDHSWERTHEVFYEAMLTSHVSSLQAKLMYAAVFFKGPRWTLQTAIIVPQDIKKNDLPNLIAKLQQEQGATSSIPSAVGVANAPLAGIADEIVVEFLPKNKSLGEHQFQALNEYIKREERMRPGSVTLESIRNFGTKPNRHTDHRRP